MTVQIIAEAGVNHNGDINIALELVRRAAQAGADYIKFQTFVTEENITQDAPKAEYQKKSTDCAQSQFEMVKKLELNRDNFYRIHEECKNCNIGFLSTAFDLPSANLLNDIGTDYIKIPSGDLINLPLLRHQAKFSKPFIVSTGMADLNEISASIKVLEKCGVQKSMITLLHCTTEYPAPYATINLRAMLTLKQVFQLNVGYSDHSQGIEIPIAATALGATIIEKHFTLDRTLPGPDHQASIDAKELEQMVKSIRNVRQALGHGEKTPHECELQNRAIARKSIVARKAINRGDLFSDDNLAIKRPGTGISPMKWDDVIGKAASKSFIKDELIVL